MLLHSVLSLLYLKGLADFLQNALFMKSTDKRMKRFISMRAAIVGMVVGTIFGFSQKIPAGNIRTAFSAIVRTATLGLISPGSRTTIVNSQYRIVLTDYANLQFLEFAGKLDAQAEIEDFLKIVGHLKKDKDVLLSLDSGGGRIDKFQAILKNIRVAIGNSNLIAYVSGRSECSSACLTLFLGADYRVASANAKFGFHAVRDSETGELIGSLSSHDYHADYGASEELMNVLEARGVFQLREIQYLTGSELLTLASVDAIVDVEDEKQLGLHFFKSQVCARLLSKASSN